VVVHQYPLGGGGGGGGGGDGNAGHTTLFSAGHGTWARDLGRGIAIVIGRHVNGQHRWATETRPRRYAVRSLSSYIKMYILILCYVYYAIIK